MSDPLYDRENLRFPAEVFTGDFPRHVPSKENCYYDPVKRAAKTKATKERRQALYQAEKILGKRSKTGQYRLKKLKAKHREMIAAFIEGWSIREIADYFSVAHVTVQRVIADPQAQAIIDEFEDGAKAEFNQMLPKVNDSIRAGLNAGDVGTKLKAVDRWGKLHRVINGETGEKSATQRTQEIHAARFSFLKKVEEIALKTGVIEAEAVIVENVDS